MSPKAQQAKSYQALPSFLRDIRETASLTQREVGRRLGKPQSWVHNCETGNRRVDITEFILWCKACEAKPENAFKHLLEEVYLYSS